MNSMWRIVSMVGVVAFGMSASEVARSQRFPTPAQVEQAVRENRFPELRDVENTMDIGKACRGYRDQATLCSFAGQEIMSRNNERRRSGQASQAQAQEAEQSRIDEALDVLTPEERGHYSRCMGTRFQATWDRAQECILAAQDARAHELARADAVAAEAARREAERERRRALDEAFEICRQTVPHKLAASANMIVFARARMEEARQALDRDKEIERLTGVVDLRVRNDSGGVLVDGASVLEREFANYRSLGGTASSVERVVEMDSPCKRAGQ